MGAEHVVLQDEWTATELTGGDSGMVKTAVIGLGRIGWQYHVPEVSAHDGFDLAAVVDLDQERIDEARRDYGVRGYADYREMLSHVNPDLVVVASPTHLHAEHAIAAMRSGADVFLDKPMAATLDEAREIDAVRRETGRKLMVYQPHRAVPEVGVIKEILELGILGPVYMVKRATSRYTRRSDWQSQLRYGGGMLNNYGAHFIDQIMFLFGGAADSVRCHRYRIASLGDADDVVKIVIKTTTGVLLDLDINQASTHEISPWMIFGKYGTLTYRRNSDGAAAFEAVYVLPEELPPLTLISELKAPGRLYDQSAPIPWKTRSFAVTPQYAVEFYDTCYAYFARNEPPFVPIESTFEVMEVLDRCRKDSEIIAI
ncbi:MAG: gfo/Idh/MocA family oxidoreductase [Spirochaetaceae bacterium]|nr:MAG: gfo/Idh/MocA family oxidoreductase [Spirochaetaceae bacterium]